MGPIIAVAAVVVAVLVVGTAVVTTRGGAAGDTGPVSSVQPFALPPVVPNGSGAALGAVPGRATVVNFFAAWCDPCRAELPLIEGASRASGAPAVIGIDVLDQRPDAQQLLRQSGVTFPAGFDHDGTVSQRWGVSGLPVTIFVAPDGHIVAYHRGQLHQRQLTDLLGRLARAA